MPPEGDSKAGFRYPFVSHEILKTGAPLILDHFFGRETAPAEDESTQASIELSRVSELHGGAKSVLRKEEMDSFFKGFLQSEASKNLVLSGYFSAIVGNFVAKKKQEMLAYFFEDPQIPELFLARLDVPSILDLLRAFLNLESDDSFEFMESDSDAGQAAASQPFTAERTQLFANLKRVYKETPDTDIKLNIKQLFASITKDVTMFCGSDPFLYAILFSETDFIDHLFRDMVSLAPGVDRLSPKTSADLLADLLSVLNPNRKIGDSLLQQSNLYPAKKKKYEQISSRLRSTAFEEKGEEAFEQIVCRGLQRISDFVERAQLRVTVNSMGAETRVLDSHLLSLFEVVLAAVHLNSDAVDAQICSLHLIPFMTVASHHPETDDGLQLELALPHDIRQVHQAHPGRPAQPQTLRTRTFSSRSCSMGLGSSSGSKKSMTKRPKTSTRWSGTSEWPTGSPRTSTRTSKKRRTL